MADCLITVNHARVRVRARVRIRVRVRVKDSLIKNISDAQPWSIIVDHAQTYFTMVDLGPHLIDRHMLNHIWWLNIMFPSKIRH